MANDYPTEAELTTYLADFGLTATNGNFAAAAATKWEADTGWNPYLGSSDDEVKEFLIPLPRDRRDGPYLPIWASTRLFLRGGVQSITSITVDGDTLVAQQDYGFLPTNGYLLEPPYTDIWIGSGVSCGKTVEITAKWGKCLELSAYVKQVVLQLAAKLAFPQLEFSATGGVQSIQTLSSKIAFGGSGGGSSTFSRTADDWQSAYQDAVLAEKLVRLGERCRI